MTQRHKFYNHKTTGDFYPDEPGLVTEPAAIETEDESGDYDSAYSFDEYVEDADFIEDYEDYSFDSDQAIHASGQFLSEDAAPLTSHGIVWTRGRILYAMLILAFIVALLVYLLVPVLDHIAHPPPPPTLPPPWMA